MSDPSDRDRVTAILTPEVVEIARRCRCCGAPSMCGACCMDDEQSHDAARLAAEIDRLARTLLEALDTIDRMGNLHFPEYYGVDLQRCVHDQHPWPCPTERALNGGNESKGESP